MIGPINAEYHTAKWEDLSGTLWRMSFISWSRRKFLHTKRTLESLTSAVAPNPEKGEQKMSILKTVFLQLRLRWLEGKIDQEFDRKLSLKIDRLHTQIEANTIPYKQETGFLAGAIKAIVKKAAVVALQWFQPKAISRAIQWIKETGYRSQKLP